MEPLLKPCPFCGADAQYIKRYRQDVFFVRCDCCLVQTDDAIGAELAADDWNSRFTPEMDILLEAVREEIKKTGGNVRLEEALDRAGLKKTG